jgi:hypothetical protein
MATILNSYNCLVPGANTGADACAIDLKNTVAIFLMPPGTKIAAADLATSAAFLTAMGVLTNAPVGTRIYPVFNLIQNADTTEATTIQTFPNGFKFPVRNGYYNPSYQFVANFCLYLQLYNGFNGKAWDILTIDAAGTGWGVKNPDGSLSGISADYIDVPTFKNNTGGAVAETTISFSAAPDFLSSFGFVKLSLAQWKTLKGLQTVTLTSGGARVANVSLVKGGIGCGQRSLAAQYTTALNVANLWVVTDSVSGNLLTLTSVAYTANIDGYTITVDTSDPDYVAGHPVNISLAAPTVLVAAGITGIESTVFTTPN